MLDITVSKSLTINILIHILILFVFLYLFFFFVISRKEQKSLEDEVDQLCRCKIPGILKNIDNSDEHNIINWWYNSIC